MPLQGAACTSGVAASECGAMRSGVQQRVLRPDPTCIVRDAMFHEECLFSNFIPCLFVLGCLAQGDFARGEIVNSGFYLQFAGLNSFADNG